MSNLFIIGNGFDLSHGIKSSYKDFRDFINQFFTEWINQVVIDNVKPRKEFQELIDHNKDIFFSTNYTLTLENVYNIRKVCHIHGKLGEDFIFGHGEDDSLYEKYEQENIGTEGYLSDIDRMLRKNVQNALKTHHSFFEFLGKTPVEKIYSYGFSYGKADLIYVQEIAKSLSRNVVWYLNSFDDANGRNSTFEYSIRACGFRGGFDRFG